MMTTPALKKMLVPKEAVENGKPSDIHSLILMIFTPVLKYFGSMLLVSSLSSISWVVRTIACSAATVRTSSDDLEIRCAVTMELIDSNCPPHP